ncbi:MAG: hypothetical protein JO069_02265 [Verrucomicrobia bacterium]|nr:hypothetical protein [Verrucomicrobiota bacterium]
MDAFPCPAEDPVCLETVLAAEQAFENVWRRSHTQAGREAVESFEALARRYDRLLAPPPPNVSPAVVSRVETLRDWARRLAAWRQEAGKGS